MEWPLVRRKSYDREVNEKIEMAKLYHKSERENEDLKQNILALRATKEKLETDSKLLSEKNIKLAGIVSKIENILMEDE